MDKYSTQVNTPPYNYGLNVLLFLHKIVDNFRHNTKTLLPSKEYNIFQHSPLIMAERRAHTNTKEGVITTPP